MVTDSWPDSDSPESRTHPGTLETASEEKVLTPIRVRLMSQRGRLDEGLLRKRMPGGGLDHGDVVFDLDGEQPADVVVVQNYLKYDQLIEARDGYVWKWDNEPIVRNRSVRGYDRIFSHSTYPGHPHREPSPPILDWWIGKTFDELATLKPPEKLMSLSAIASMKTQIPGHRLRNAFINQIEDEFPDLQVFGHGRQKALGDKWDGLAPFTHSLAIENTSKPDYWTEKIADCFLSYTVPIYYGATNLSEYFPPRSFIWLPLDDFDAAKRIIRDVLQENDWDERLDAIQTARELILNKYSFYAQLTRRVRNEAQIIRTQSHRRRLVFGRRTRRGGWIRGLGLIKNLEARISRQRERSRSAQFAR